MLARSVFCSIALGATLLLASSGVGATDGALRPLADETGLTLGAAVDVAALDDSATRDLFDTHLNMLSTRDDLSMTKVQPEPGVFDFANAEAVVDAAVAADQTVRGHELIGPDVPAWVRDGAWTAETLAEVLRAHITTVVEHFRERNPGAITQWDVVGEAFLPDGTPRPTIWQQVIGDDHLRIAFEAARAADPEATLFYDDFYDDFGLAQDAVAGGVGIVPGATATRTTCDEVAKCVGVRDRIAALVAQQVPIDGFGVQAHLFSPDPLDLAVFTDWVGDLGMVWAVTEFDVPLPITEVDAPDSLAFQARVYADALVACADAAGCDTFVTWGVSDRFSPIPFESGGAFGGALWFDAADRPKPAFDAMAEVLSSRTTTPAATTLPDDTLPDDTLPDDTLPEDTGADETVVPSSPTTPDDDGDGTALVIGAAAMVAIGAVVVIVRRRRNTAEPSENA